MRSLVLEEFASNLQKPYSDETSRAIPPAAEILKHGEFDSAVLDLLAVACRDAKWRQELSEKGYAIEAASILNNERDELATNVPRTRNLLRFASNAIADMDVNREVMLPHIETMAKLAEQKELRYPALIALMNICTSYEPAQNALADQSIHQLFVPILDKSDLEESELTVLIDVLTLAQKAVSRSANSFSEKLLAPLIQAVCSFTSGENDEDDEDDEDAWENVEALLPILREPKVIATLGSSECLEPVIRLVETCIGRAEQFEFDTDEDAVKLFNQAVELASEVSCSWGSLPLHFPLSVRGRAWAAGQITMGVKLQESGSEAKKQKGHFYLYSGTMALGNVITSDEISNVLGQDQDLLSNVYSILSHEDNRKVLHATAGLLRNILVSKANKERLAQTDGPWSAVVRLLKSEDERLTAQGLALLTTLLQSPVNVSPFLADRCNVLENFKRLLQGHVDDQNAADSKTVETSPSVRVASATALLIYYRSRMGLKGASGADSQPALPADPFEDSEAAARALLFLTMYPDAERNKNGWMGLSLMAQSPKGALTIYQTLKRKEFSLAKLLAKAIEAFDGAKDEDEVKALRESRDYGNTFLFAQLMLAHLIQKTELSGDEIEAATHLFASKSGPESTQGLAKAVESASLE